MSHNPQRIGALVDGELGGLRRWLVRRHLDRCAICATEYRRQRDVRRLVADNLPAAPQGDSAEFFWAKVKAAIERRDPAAPPVALPPWRPADWLREHRLAVAAVTVMLIAGLTFLGTLARPRAPLIARATVVSPSPAPRPAATVVIPKTGSTILVAQTSPKPAPPAASEVEHADSDIPSAAVTTFDATDAGVTVIWVTGLPWTPNMNAMETAFANPSS